MAHHLPVPKQIPWIKYDTSYNYGLNRRQPANSQTDTTNHMLQDDSKWLTLIPSIYVSSQNYFMFFYVVDPLTFSEKKHVVKIYNFVVPNTFNDN
jgi:hypothetical protein